MGVILLAAFFFLVDGFPLLTVTLLSSGGVFVARIIIYWLQNGDVAGRMNAFYARNRFLYKLRAFAVFVWISFKKSNFEK